MRKRAWQLLGLAPLLTCMIGMGAKAENLNAPAPAGATDGTFSLEICAPFPSVSECTVLPPPGKYDFPKGDTVLLQGCCGKNPGSVPLWSGDATGSGILLPLPMDSPKRITPSFTPVTNASAMQPAAVDAPATGVLHTLIGSGRMCGWFSADRAHMGVGAGITHLVSFDNPCFPVFARPNLNFEHIVNGVFSDMHRSLNTPRTDPMQVRVLSPASVEVFWPAATSSWGIDCRMRYTFTGDNAIDMEFEAIPRKDEAPKGWLLFMWASYMQMVRARTIHFRGTDGGGEKWVAFGSTGKSGTVAGKEQSDLPQDDGYQRFNARIDPDVRFTIPFYYGLRDADMDPGTTDDTMAYIMMFDDPMTSRFAVWNWGDDPAVSAWDWQFIIRNPRVGQAYRHRSRMVYKPFTGEDDVLAEYNTWRGSLAAGGEQPSLPLVEFPVHIAPGTLAYSHAAILDKAQQENPDFALRACTNMLGSTLYAEDAARRIDEISAGKGSNAAVAQWQEIISQQPKNALAWHHLGQAQEKQNDWAKAEEAYAKAVELDATCLPTQLRLSMVRVMRGETTSGMALAAKAVSKGAESARALAMECTRIADSQKESGNTKLAADLFALATVCDPGNNAYRMLWGETLEREGDWDGALRQYRQVMDASPESGYAAARVEGVYREHRDPVGLVSEWQSIAGAHSDAFTPEFRLGLALETLGDLAGAEGAYRESLLRCPGETDAEVRLAGLAAAAGEVQKALRRITALAADGSETALHGAWACGNAAQVRLASGDLPGAAALLREARRLAPADLSHRVALGSALEAAGDDEGALAEYRAVAMEVPEAPHSGDRIDAIYLRRNTPEARVAEWRNLVTSHPDAVFPRVRLGLALEAAGDAPGAEAAFREALSRNAQVEVNSPLFRMVKQENGGAK